MRIIGAYYARGSGYGSAHAATSTLNKMACAVSGRSLVVTELHRWPVSFRLWLSHEEVWEIVASDILCIECGHNIGGRVEVGETDLQFHLEDSDPQPLAQTIRLGQ